MPGKSVILGGATGMVGGHALALCCQCPEIGAITSVGRRTTATPHPKLREVLHDDFTNFDPVASAFAGQDVALYCVGAYTGTVPDEQFRSITVDATLAFARTLRTHSPGAAFCFLSGQGADPTGKSRMAFARYKGEAERALLEMGFARVHIFRPGYIYPVTPRQEPNRSYRVMRAIYPVLRRVAPNLSVTSHDLARAMVHAGLHGTGSHLAPVLENADIRALAAAVGEHEPLPTSP